jgi:thiamine kinase-like enzyme
VVAVEGDARRYFVKVPGEGSEMFINRVTANEAARNAHAMGIAPEVVFFDAADGLEVSEFLEGYSACTNADFGDGAIQADVLALYRRFHAGPPLGQTKTIFDMIEEHIEQAHALGAHFPVDMPWIAHRYRQAKAAFLAAGLDLVPCFNDPMPGNFLISRDPAAPKPMRLIDYEFASNNERSYELGVLFGEMFFDEALTERLIGDYCGGARPDMVARVIVNRALADVKWASWAIVNRKLKTWDFDYQKYGAWKYMRARDIMLDPRWDSWLRRV